jgi:hypothetical protein
LSSKRKKLKERQKRKKTREKRREMHMEEAVVAYAPGGREGPCHRESLVLQVQVAT